MELIKENFLEEVNFTALKVGLWASRINRVGRAAGRDGSGGDELLER